MIHFRMGFAYSQTSDGVTVQLHLGDSLRVICTDVLVGPTLVNPKQKLVGD